MSVWPALEDHEFPVASADVIADIKATRNTDFINNFWRVLANDPVLLERIWSDLKQVMAPGAIDPLTKEMLYVAVSITNGCDYCIRSHTSAARAKGMSEAQLSELLAIVGMASETNRLATGLQVPVDAAFLEPRKPETT